MRINIKNIYTHKKKFTYNKYMLCAESIANNLTKILNNFSMAVFYWFDLNEME